LVVRVPVREVAVLQRAQYYQEIKTKGKDARFRKTERGKFAATGIA